jgi:L-serine/L-threonine ammonia-lyase
MGMGLKLDYPDLHKFLVELACGTALSPAFNREFFQACCPDVKPEDSVVFVCCGGIKIGLDEMQGYREIIRKEDAESYRRATLDGRVYNFT